MKRMQGSRAIVITTAVILAVALLGASSADAAAPGVTLSGNYSGNTHTVSDGCGFHSVNSFAATAKLTPGPRLQGTLVLDYCTAGGPLVGTWTLTTRQGTLSGGYGTWSRSSLCQTPTIGCVDHLSMQLLPVSGTRIFTRFTGGQLQLDADNTMTSGAFPNEWWGTTTAIFDGTLTW